MVKICVICGNENKRPQATKYCGMACHDVGVEIRSELKAGKRITFGLYSKVKRCRKCRNIKPWFRKSICGKCHEGAKGGMVDLRKTREARLSRALRGPSVGRFAILRRDEFRCVYCGASPASEGLTLNVDHVIPVVSGGKHVAANVVTSCENCNKAKCATRLPQSVEFDILTAVARRNEAAGIDPQRRYRDTRPVADEASLLAHDEQRKSKGE